MSITRRGRHRKLHLVEACRYKPGLDYKDWVDCGEVIPPEHDFQSVCKFCLPAGAGPPEAPEDSGSSSSSSGDEAAEPAHKRAKQAENQEPEGAD